MKADIRNIEVIAQKEFADHLYSPGFRMLLGIFTLMIVSMSVVSGKNGHNIFEFGFLDVAQVITLFIPVLGLALGFDSVVREKNSKSLNTLLTHPVFRDNIISGKIIGSLGTLTLVVFISVVASIGTLLILTGIDVGLSELNRILIFSVLTFLYLSGFFCFQPVNFDYFKEFRGLFYLRACSVDKPDFDLRSYSYRFLIYHNRGIGSQPWA